MKKFLSILVLGLTLFQPLAFGAEQWAKTEPQGTQNMSDIDTLIQTNNEALDRLNFLDRVNCTVVPNSSSQVTVLAGTMAIPNASGSVVRYRRTTNSSTVGWSDIDTGAEANSTQYYVYATADTDITGIVYKISTSSSAPSGSTYYRKIGYFYNNSSGNIVNVGNIKGGDVPNKMQVVGTTDITTSSATPADMDDMTCYFVSSGRPVTIEWTGNIFPPSGNGSSAFAVIDVDGTDKIKSQITSANSADGYIQSTPVPVKWTEALSSGVHTIKIQWYVDSGSANQYGTQAERLMSVEEA